ncbi:MAG: diguanylate cyclase [Deltaproteobacteria bacterium]|nr:diguanylate cyclase [Deltaproteobacteria bacterium]
MRDAQKILIVDDDVLIRNMVSDTIANAGYEAMAAADGYEVLHKVSLDKPDLILLDVVMPGIDGIEVCKRLRANHDSLSLPIIILTSRAEKDDILNGLKAGANDYIIKPIEPLELNARIETHLCLKNLYDKVNAEKNDLFALLSISQTVASTLKSNDIMHTIVKKVAEVIEVSRCSIVKIGKKKDVGYILTTYEDPDLKDFPIELNKYPEIKKAIETKGTVVINDIHNDPLMIEVRDYLKALDFNSILIIPIIVRSEPVGILFLRTSRRIKTFTPREIKLCQVIANLAGNALVNAHLFESIELANLDLERLAITDGLTGAYNHRYFRTRIEQEFNRAARYKTFLSCIMLDIDYFKDINDAFGHGQGDTVLKELTDIMKNNARNTDIVARYGGEEFVIILPQTDKEGAFIQAERIRNAINGYKCCISDKCVMLTISLGAATFPSENIKTIDDLVGAADAALYEAKKGGKNRTVSAYEIK